jgi:hypothetical protein
MPKKLASGASRSRRGIERLGIIPFLLEMVEGAFL